MRDRTSEEKPVLDYSVPRRRKDAVQQLVAGIVGFVVLVPGSIAVAVFTWKSEPIHRLAWWLFLVTAGAMAVGIWCLVDALRKWNRASSAEQPWLIAHPLVTCILYLGLALFEMVIRLAGASYFAAWHSFSD